MTPADAATRADRLINAAMHGHQRLDCLRQDLIRELLTVYERGVADERARKERCASEGE